MADGIHAVREPFPGYWQTTDYAYWDYVNGKPVRRGLGEMKLKSQIARPTVYETLKPNQVYTVCGAAWAGEAEVAEIAVSTGGGQTWAEAEFLDPVQRYAWRRWKFAWLTPKQPGKYTLLARAKDDKGGAQPDKHDQNYDPYVINYPLPIEVFVGMESVVKSVSVFGFDTFLARQSSHRLARRRETRRPSGTCIFPGRVP